MKVSELEGAELNYWVAKATGAGLYRFMPSTDWSQGGPLIAAHQIDITSSSLHDWEAVCWSPPAGAKEESFVKGKTPLQSAMRALVASVYGDTVKEGE